MNEENMSANITYVLNKLKTYEAANDTTTAQLMRRISMLENELKQTEFLLKDEIFKLKRVNKTLDEKLELLAAKRMTI